MINLNINKIFHRLPDEIVETYADLINEIHQEEFWAVKAQQMKHKGLLKIILQMSCYGFNSGLIISLEMIKRRDSARFDIPCLLPGIMKWVAKNEFNHDLIMKGSSFIYLQLTSPDEKIVLAFKDVLQMSSPCSLSQFLKQWRIPEAKGIFPHG